MDRQTPDDCREHPGDPDHRVRLRAADQIRDEFRDRDVCRDQGECRDRGECRDPDVNQDRDVYPAPDGHHRREPVHREAVVPVDRMETAALAVAE